MSKIGFNRPDQDAYQFQSLIQKNPAALGYFYEKYYEPLYSSILSLTGEKAVAEDVVHDAFIKLSQHPDRINNVAHIKGFLYTAAKHHCWDYLRKQQVQQRYRVALSNWLAGKYESQEEVEMIKNEVLAIVYRHIEKLPEKRKQIFIHHYLEEMEITDIAQKLGLSPRTVRNQLVKGVNTLKIAFSDKDLWLLFLLLFTIQDS